MPSCVAHEKPGQFALLDCTQPGRGKSQAIQHNRALPKVGQSLRRASLGGLPLARPAGSGNGRLCLAPRPGQQLCQFALLGFLFRRYAQGGVDPPPARRVCLRRLALRCSCPPRQHRSHPPRRGSPNARPPSRQRRLSDHCPTGGKAIRDTRLRNAAECCRQSFDDSH